MTALPHPTLVEENAYTAVCLGRALAEAWPKAPVEFTSTLDRRISSTLTRLAEGDVFQREDDLTISHMVSAVRQTLNHYREGFGDFWLRESTGEHPLFDMDRDLVRSTGEQLKSFIEARDRVINAILAEKQVVFLRKR